MTGSSTIRPRALVLGPSFFGYERDIVAELQHQGYDAEFLDERPSNSPLARAIVRVRKSLLAPRIETHYKRAQAHLAGRSFDLVLVIKGEVVPRWFLDALRQQSPQARFVFYTYDSLSNSPNCLHLLDCFDERLSFDRDDVMRRPDFSYLPLFHAPAFVPLARADAARTRRYRVSFVGTLHSERYEFVKKLCAGRFGNFEFFYVQARWYFAVVKYFTREHRAVDWNEVSFTPMGRSEIAEVFRESHAVLDMQRPGQSGLTMRTFEVLAAGAILVTTNAAIKHEPFYDPSRVVVVPANLTEIDTGWVNAQLDALTPPSGPPAGFEAYSLSAWVRSVSVADSSPRDR